MPIIAQRIAISDVIRRGFWFFAVLFWCAAFGALWAYSPLWVKAVSAGWALTAFVSPPVYLVSLAHALPLFGDNPGGVHQLYLLDMGLMGWAVRDAFERAFPKWFSVATENTSRSTSQFIMQALAVGFLATSFASLMAEWGFLKCEVLTYGFRSLHNAFVHHATSPIYGARAWMNLALSIAVFAALIRRPIEEKWRWRFWFALFASLLIVSAMGALDYFGVISLKWWRPENPYIARFGYRRLQSLFGHSGWFGQYLAAVAPAALAFGWVAVSPPKRAAGFALALFLTAIQALTMQRGAWLALAAGYGVVAAGAWLGKSGDAREKMLKQFAIVAVAAALVLIVLAALQPALRNRATEMFRMSDRQLIWAGAWRLGTFRPMIGIGTGSYSFAHRTLIAPDDPLAAADDRTAAHNLVLHLFAERGVVGTAFFVLLLGGAFGILIRRIREPDGTLRVEQLALLGGLTALLVDGIFQYTFYIRLTEILFWIFIAFVISMPVRGASEISRRKMAGAWIAVVAIFLLIAFLNVRRYHGQFDKMHDAEAGIFKVAGAEVIIPIPRNGDKISIRVISKDPANLTEGPITLAFWLEGRLLAVRPLKSGVAEDVVLEMPREERRHASIIVKASRVWRPFEYTNREIPILEAGVCYQDPVRVQSTEP